MSLQNVDIGGTMSVGFLSSGSQWMKSRFNRDRLCYDRLLTQIQPENAA